MQKVGRCKHCRDLTELEICTICANPRRDQSQLCIVESPVDVLAIEQATAYKGRYFVLLGRLSPLDGIGPAELGLDQLAERLENDAPEEMIVATNPTVEGEATSYYLQKMAKTAQYPRYPYRPRCTAWRRTRIYGPVNPRTRFRQPFTG